MQIFEDNPLSEYKGRQVVFPHNQVLYGVSGTGKSYLATYYAVAVIERVRVQDLQKEAHEEVMKRFREYQKEGQIAWLTLHENYTYANLIQAYQPQAGKQDGLWKKMADRAQASYDFVMRTHILPTFQELLNLYIARHINPDTEEIEFTLPTPKRDYESIIITKITQETLAYKRKTKKNIRLKGNYTLQVATLADMYAQTTKQYEGVGNVDYEAVLYALRAYTHEQADKNSKLPNYVLILDEMQSVNLPALLGEGMSLLENDRRTGASNALMITLPSGDVLRFPPNLFLIGTWNTSDCALPTQGGLLRRFAWIACPVQYDLIEDVALRVFCEALNEALERELQTTRQPVGHTYFLGQSKEALPTLLQQHLLPLLQEILPNQNKKIAHILQTAKAKSGL